MGVNIVICILVLLSTKEIKSTFLQGTFPTSLFVD